MSCIHEAPFPKYGFRFLGFDILWQMQGTDKELLGTMLGSRGDDCGLGDYYHQTAHFFCLSSRQVLPEFLGEWLLPYASS